MDSFLFQSFCISDICDLLKCIFTFFSIFPSDAYFTSMTIPTSSSSIRIKISLNPSPDSLFDITDQYDIVAIEDIDMKAMSQCLHFGKSVQDNGYGMFRNMLDYKLSWKGKELVKIDRFFPSSKKCSKCGKIKKELKLSERVYRCTCGNEMDRDRNAAINIREEARRMLTA